jgi:predicted TIM-barrel fold metal-dependent hydrolase
LHQFADADSRWSQHHHTEGAAARLRKVAQAHPIKGLTHYVHAKNDGWFRSADGIAFFEAAAELRLIVSLAASPAWQEDLRAVACRFPCLPILCHHLAGIRSWAGGAEEGLRMVLPSTACPNILIKLSGLYYGSDRPWEYPNAEGMAIARTLHQHFGAERLVWGSDYPVVRRALTYRQALEAVRTHCDFIPEADLVGVLGQRMAELLRVGQVEA